MGGVNTSCVLVSVLFPSHGAEVPARFVIIDGRFVEIEPGSG
jgi:hypothetical protein